jgi:hypothetical protein
MGFFCVDLTWVAWVGFKRIEVQSFPMPPIFNNKSGLQKNIVVTLCTQCLKCSPMHIQFYGKKVKFCTYEKTM